MTDQLIQVAQAEENALVAELRQTAAYRKLEAVRALIAAYQTVALTPRPIPTGRPVPAGSSFVPSQRQGSREGSLSNLLTTFAAEHLRKVGHRLQTPELVGPAFASGIEIKNDKPVNTMASILSHSALFNNVRGKGYGLSEWGMGDGPAASAVHEQPASSLSAAQYRSLTLNPGAGWGAVHVGTEKPQPDAGHHSADHLFGHDSGRIKDEVA